MRRGFVFLGVLATGCLVAPAADAQMRDWEDTAFVSVNFGYQVGDRSFSETLSATIYDETATYGVNHESGRGGFSDISGGVRVWRNLAAGLGVTRFSTASGATVTGSIPHPLFLNQLRTATFARSDLNHTETGIHLQAVWVVPVTDQISVSVFGGPSFFSVEQGLITSVTFAEIEAPFFEVAITGASTSIVSERAVGGNVGVDITYLVVEQLGGGFFVRYAGASLDVPAGGGAQAIDVGGVQFGIGLRARF
jgi:hypothetical protein